MANAAAELLGDKDVRRYWNDYDRDKTFVPAKIDGHEWIPEATRERIRAWAKTKTVAVAANNDDNTKPDSPYKPINDPNEIRVLEIKPGKEDAQIKCSLHHCSVEYQDPESVGKAHAIPGFALSMADLTTPISYTALSYAWGSSPAHTIIRCDDCSVRITSSLESALRQFRDEEQSVMLWADQICIDQSNPEEKNQQIPLMSRIYRYALNTAIWLGEASYSSDTAISLLKEIDICLQFTMDDTINRFEFERLGLPVSWSEDWRGLWELLSREWFTRLWIIQELILSRDPWITCGKSQISWESLSSACRQLVTTGISKWIQKDYVPWPERDDFCQLAWKLDQMKQRAKDNQSTLFSLLVESRDALSTDLRDKVYGLLGLCDDIDRSAVKVSYASYVTELYHFVVVHHLSRDPREWDLTEILSSVDHYCPYLPSWVPNWADSRQTVALGYKTASHGIYRAHGRFAPQILKANATVDKQNYRELRVRGILFDTVVKTSDCFGNPDVTFEQPETENKTLMELRSVASELQEHPAPNTVFSAFWHTIVAGKDSNGRLRCPDSWAEIVSILLDASTGMTPSLPSQTYTARQRRPKGRGSIDLRRFAYTTTFQEFRTAMVNALKNRITSNGYMGLFPGHVDIGDEVYVLDGCHVPFAMRREGLEGARFMLVGECYVHGIMHGEAVRPDASLEEMVLT